MNSIIDQQRNDKDFMLFIDPIGYYYLNFEESSVLKYSDGFNHGNITMDDVLIFAVQTGRLELSQYFKYKRWKNKNK